MTKLPHRHGLSLLEMVISLGLLGLVIVSALGAVDGTARYRRHGYDEPRAVVLARDLMAEVLLNDYEEPFEAHQFGPEVSETGGDRSAFDDVDDYHLWAASPPERPDGTLLPGLAGWSRSVEVSYRQAPVPSQFASGTSGIKAITVTVVRDGRIVAELTTLRTESWSWRFE